MAASSTMLPLYTTLPEFELPDVRTGRMVSSATFDGHPLLVVFLCVHCPYVKRIQDGLADFGKAYENTELRIVGIAANDVGAYPEDAPENQARVAAEIGINFPILYDESQAVASAFTAACTPDFFLFDADQELVYRGQFDEARPSNEIPVTGESLRAAVDDVLAGDEVKTAQKPSLGCSIKWKSDGLISIT
ncbi:MAG: thioredoxin family protein [Acidimicrobiia bacterium]|nr:thioredoxin family protein [Acidimicrobiia bacterium]MDQ3501898.1 thioredoxin family protein [Actinomycetota bacterium]